MSCRSSLVILAMEMLACYNLAFENPDAESTNLRAIEAHKLY